jgi:hypothetical protein
MVVKIEKISDLSKSPILHNADKIDSLASY